MLSSPIAMKVASGADLVAAATAAMEGAPPLCGPVHVELAVEVAREADTVPSVAAHVDSIVTELTGIVWRSTEQVTDLTARRRVGESSRLTITATPMTERG